MCAYFMPAYCITTDIRETVWQQSKKKFTQQRHWYQPGRCAYAIDYISENIELRFSCMFVCANGVLTRHRNQMPCAAMTIIQPNAFRLHEIIFYSVGCIAGHGQRSVAADASVACNLFLDMAFAFGSILVGFDKKSIFHQLSIDNRS